MVVALGHIPLLYTDQRGRNLRPFAEQLIELVLQVEFVLQVERLVLRS